MTQTIDHAMARSISRTHQRFQDQLLSLATMASLAPLLGLACTIRSFLMDAFRHHGSEKSQILANTAIGVAVACVPAALGIAGGACGVVGVSLLSGTAGHARS
ncbi:MAG: MotA/TolQ/ExbB proton channel family protein [Acidobacteria bacterium]|nr:MotA/TolQ/ExbB proton channel family protein [Acidobacteriota bacterium]